VEIQTRVAAVLLLRVQGRRVQDALEQDKGRTASQLIVAVVFPRKEGGGLLRDADHPARPLHLVQHLRLMFLAAGRNLAPLQPAHPLHHPVVCMLLLDVVVLPVLWALQPFVESGVTLLGVENGSPQLL
jgi:hypothetical protein